MNTQAGASVRLEGISKSYGAAKVVDDVSLNIQAGDFVTLLGASGSGKTTLLRIIAGFLGADGGEVHIAGQAMSRTPVHLRRIGMVFQSYALFPHMSVRRNVSYPLARQRFPRKERKRLVDEALAAVQLEEFGDRPPGSLSGGQQQRVALARAIVTKPRLLLMDEPLAALDRRLRESLQLEIRRLSHELGVTVINVTHDQEEALSMSDRIALLANGKVEQFDAPRVLFDRPNTEYVASFLGESTILRGTFGSDQAGGRLWLNGAASDEMIVRVPSNAPAEGRRGILVVRPENITVQLAPPAQDPSLSSLRGVVSESVFTGGSVKYLIRTASGQEIIARMTPDPQREPRPGESVFASWPSENAVAIEN